MANVLDAASGQPLGGARPTLLMQCGGVRLGLMGAPRSCSLFCCGATH